MSRKSASDYLVLGAGVVGLAIAREIKRRDASASVVVLEKEPSPGLHSSGRNSGVLHSGIYYPVDSLKARICAAGAREMAAYCVENGLPIVRRGKVLVATREEDAPQFDLLLERAGKNGVAAEKLDQQGLRECEPAARSVTDSALWVPSTTVGSPGAVMHSLAKEVVRLGVELHCDARIQSIVPDERRVMLENSEEYQYGHVINATGLHADRIAHRFGVGLNYTMLPFKGIYWKLAPHAGLNIRRLIYPVPDLRVPFLGVHSTTTTDGSVYFGPTAVPAFSRENYRGLDGVRLSEMARISWLLTRQLVSGRDAFRTLAWQEGRRYSKRWFVSAAQAIVPALKSQQLLKADKVGIRAQMLDRSSGHLVNDFIVENGPSSTHILNAISPAWTCAFPFARLVLDNYIQA